MERDERKVFNHHFEENVKLQIGHLLNSKFDKHANSRGYNSEDLEGKSGEPDMISDTNS